jgi:hypothetical protein
MRAPRLLKPPLPQQLPSPHSDPPLTPIPTPQRQITPSSLISPAAAPAGRPPRLAAPRARPRPRPPAAERPRTTRPPRRRRCRRRIGEPELPPPTLRARRQRRRLQALLPCCPSQPRGAAQASIMPRESHTVQPHAGTHCGSSRRPLAARCLPFLGLNHPSAPARLRPRPCLLALRHAPSPKAAARPHNLSVPPPGARAPLALAAPPPLARGRLPACGDAHTPAVHVPGQPRKPAPFGLPLLGPAHPPRTSAAHCCPCVRLAHL